MKPTVMLYIVTDIGSYLQHAFFIIKLPKDHAATEPKFIIIPKMLPVATPPMMIPAPKTVTRTDITFLKESLSPNKGTASKTIKIGLVEFNKEAKDASQS